jgi:hypothetical protein
VGLQIRAGREGRWPMFRIKGRKYETEKKCALESGACLIISWSAVFSSIFDFYDLLILTAFLYTIPLFPLFWKMYTILSCFNYYLGHMVSGISL